MNIQDIAKLCGVSTATVSRVLNDSRRVKQETREHVQQVMREYGYTPNAFARGLGLNSMRMVGILCTDVADLYYAKAVSLIEHQLREHGYGSLLCCTGNQMEDKKRELAMLLEKRVDAIILVGSSFREEKDNSHIVRAAQNVPVIIINGLISIPNVYCVICDEKAAMAQNVRLLAEKGCRDILYIYDTMTYSGSQKLEGYYQGLAACGITPRREWLVKTEKSLHTACQAVCEALDEQPGITAVMASEDLLAVGAQKALAERGRRLPIIGFNNSMYAQCATPALTSVDNMLDTICPTAINLLSDLLADKEVPDKIVISAKLVERDSFCASGEGYLQVI